MLLQGQYKHQMVGLNVMKEALMRLNLQLPWH